VPSLNAPSEIVSTVPFSASAFHSESRKALLFTERLERARTIFRNGPTKETALALSELLEPLDPVERIQIAGELDPKLGGTVALTALNPHSGALIGLASRYSPRIWVVHVNTRDPNRPPARDEYLKSLV